MSFADWLVATHRRVRRHSLRFAVERSLRDLAIGALRRGYWARYQLLGAGYTVRHAGVEFEVSLHEPIETERARNLRSEREVAEWLFTGFDEGYVFWDVGGYQGHFSLIAAGHGGDVVAFEPVAANRARIEENAELNDFGDRLNVRSFALSDTVDEARIETSAPNQATVGDVGEPVTLRPGDGLDVPRPDTVKIDVEGHELAVLDGMEKTLNEVTRIVIEVHDAYDVEPVKERLREAGLNISEVGAPREQIYVGGYRDN